MTGRINGQQHESQHLYQVFINDQIMPFGRNAKTQSDKWRIGNVINEKQSSVSQCLFGRKKEGALEWGYIHYSLRLCLLLSKKIIITTAIPERAPGLSALQDPARGDADKPSGGIR